MCDDAVGRDGRRTPVLVGCASGAEGLLSRSIGMRLPGLRRVTRWGLFSRRGGFAPESSHMDGMTAFPRMFSSHFLHSGLQGKLSFPSMRRGRVTVGQQVLTLGPQVHMMKTILESSTKASDTTSRCRHLFTQSLRTLILPAS